MQDDGIAYLLIQFVDIHGAAKVKLVPARHVAGRGRSRARASRAGPSGAWAKAPTRTTCSPGPTSSTYTPLPYEPGVARFAADLYVDRQPHPYCPRVNLKRCLAEAGERGYVFNVGIEPEFFLVVKNADGSIRGWDPHGVDDLAKPCYDYKGISGALGFLRALNDALDRLGWGVYQTDHEDANFQYEVNFQYADALDDRRSLHVLPDDGRPARPAARARSRRSWPSRSRPAPARAPTCIIIWPTPRPGATCFSTRPTRADLGLSTLAYHFIGGVLEHAPALCAVTSPTVNCYKRLQMGPALTGSRSGYTWTPAFITYGDNNRTQMLRVPEGGHVEDRSISSAFNPYLGIAAYLAAGLDGIARELDPGEPNLGNLYTADLETMARRGVRTLPPEPRRGPRPFRARSGRPRKPRPDRRRVPPPQARRVARVSRPGRVVGNQALPHGALRASMETWNAKNVIIGAGAMGSAAAYHLARRGEPVVLIEQFALGHDRGSSHGAARITRHSYADPAYARLMPAAFRAWRELEADAGETVYFRTGGVSFSPPGVDYAGQVAANLAELGVPHWRSSGERVERALSGLFAARRLRRRLRARRRHARRRARRRAQGRAGPAARRRADAGARANSGPANRSRRRSPGRRDRHARIRADRLIVSAGAWVKQLLPELAVPLDVTRQQVLVRSPGRRGAVSHRPLPGLHLQGSRR